MRIINNRQLALAASKKMRLKLAAFLSTLIFVSVSYSNPSLNNVENGSASISQTATTTTVNQTSSKAIINWNSFNIAAGEKTQFVQPNSSSVALNRINPLQGASQIYGSLTSNGQIVLVNAAGIHFGAGSMVNVGGMIASTSDITNANFLAGNYIFSIPGNYHGDIINEGRLIAANHGLIALLGNNVQNNGLIEAESGSIVLGAGKVFTLDFYGDQLINFTVNESAKHGGKIKNTGTLLADGGKILVTAQAARSVLDNAIDMQGVAQARSVDKQSGEIILSSDADISVAGTLDASGVSAGALGGTIEVLGNNIKLTSTARVNANGDAGGGIILIGGDFHGDGPEQNALTTSVSVGAIIEANAVTAGNGGQIAIWSNKNTEFHGSVFATGGTQSGNGGYVETSGSYLDVTSATINLLAPKGKTGSWLLDPTDIYIADNQTDATNAGMTTTDNSADSGSGTNPTIFSATDSTLDSLLTTGSLETALATSNVIVTTTNVNGTGFGDITIVDPINWSAATNLTLSAYRNINVNANISNVGSGAVTVALQSDNTGTGIGTVAFNNGSVVSLPIHSNANIYYNPAVSFEADALSPPSFYSGGTPPTAYMLINSIGSASDMGDTANTDTLAALSNNSALWSSNFALSQNIDAAVTSTWNSGAGFTPIANGSPSFTGNFDGQEHVISGLFIDLPNSTNVGLFGSINGNGIIQNFGLTGDQITGNQNVGSIAGEVAGYNTVTNVYNTGSVTLTMNGIDVGGLVGAMQGGVALLSNSYNTGAIVAETGSAYVGGLLGSAYNANITNSYNTGSVTANYSSAHQVGGLIGHDGSAVSNAYNSGNITVGNLANEIGGLFGFMGGYSVDASYNTGTITTGDYPSAVGGIAGQMYGAMTNTYNAGSITAGLATGGSVIGGLVGINEGTIENAYNLGSVNVGSNGMSDSIGGLVGYNDTNSTINNTYSSGLITTNVNTTNVGGLVGNNLGTATNSFWDTTTSGQATIGYNNSGSGLATNVVGGCFGSACATNLAAFSTYDNAGWDISDTPSTSAIIPGSAWFIFDGSTRPLLMSEYSTTITNAHQLQLAGSTIGANYILGNNIDASATQNNAAEIWGTSTTNGGAGFRPIGYSTYAFIGFNGNFDGQNHVIENLFINLPLGNSIGLFSVIGDINLSNNANVIQNLGLVQDHIIGGSSVGGLAGFLLPGVTLNNVYNEGVIELAQAFSTGVGGLVGVSQRVNITNSHNSGTIIAGDGSSEVGGLAGAADGIISNSYNSANMIIGNDVDAIGGLVGLNSATISDSYNTGNVTESGNASFQIGGLVGASYSGTIMTSFNSGNISVGTNANDVGGLIGDNAGVINNSYNIGNVTTSTGASSDSIGGLAGYNETNGTINNTYTANLVTTDPSSTNVGSIIGNNSGTITNSFWDSTVSALPGCGSAACTGATGKTTSGLESLSTFNNARWSISSSSNTSYIWGIDDGNAYPYLQSAQVPLSISGLVSNLSGTLYVLANGTLLSSTDVITNTSTNYLLNLSSTLANNTALLVYLLGSNGNDVANGVGLWNGTSITGLNLSATTVSIGSDATATLSTTTLANALGSYSSGGTNVLYSYTSPNLTLNSGISLATTATTTFALNDNIISSGSQTYHGALTLGADVTLATTANNSSIAITDGIANSAGKSITLSGSANNTNTFTVIGPLTLANITIAGGSNGNSTLVLGDANQTWNITGANSGNLTGIADGSVISGAFNFTDIANLSTGSGNNNFILDDGGALTGTITAGVGANTLIAANTGGPNTWTITAADAGTLANEGNNLISFSGIQTIAPRVEQPPFL
jgi:filamentous hemagglutinin family protein